MVVMILKMSTVSKSKLVVKLCQNTPFHLLPLYQLGKTVGQPLHIYGRWFRSHRYAIGLDSEEISGAGFLGLSAKSGYLITLNFKNCDAEGWTSSVPTRMYCALHYDAVLNIQDSGVQVLD